MTTKPPTIYLRMGKNPHPAYDAYRHVSIPYQWPVESKSPKKESPFVVHLKKTGWSLYSKLKPIPTLPIHIHGVDLIHSTNNMLLETNQDWVVDCEYVGAFLGFRYDHLDQKRNQLNRIISNSHCKGILFWSQAAKHSFELFIQNPSLSKKCFIVYPTVVPPKNVLIRKSLKRLLFVGSPFYEKGGKEALAAFRIAHQKHPKLSMTVVSNTPDTIRQQYAGLPVQFLPPQQNREQMNALYHHHDAFILPTFKDSYGIVFLEALSHALPVITTDMFACPELITPNQSGLIVPAPFNAYTSDFFFDVEKYDTWEEFSYYCQTAHHPAFEDALAQQILKLTGKKVERFSKAALKSYQKKFSLSHFEKQLRAAYEKALEKK